MQPEIFNVCASEGVSSVWEEPVEYRVDTPFSAAKRDQQALPFNLNGLTPPPAPRRGLPYLQYLGQITPTRRQSQMQTPQSSTDLDVTPVATPLKVRTYVCMYVLHAVYDVVEAHATAAKTVYNVPSGSSRSKRGGR